MTVQSRLSFSIRISEAISMPTVFDGEKTVFYKTERTSWQLSGISYKFLFENQTSTGIFIRMTVDIYVLSNHCDNLRSGKEFCLAELLRREQSLHRQKGPVLCLHKGQSLSSGRSGPFPYDIYYSITDQNIFRTLPGSGSGTVPAPRGVCGRSRSQ